MNCIKSLNSLIFPHGGPSVRPVQSCRGRQMLHLPAAAAAAAAVAAACEAASQPARKSATETRYVISHVRS